jgi:hypothetical protein
MTGCRYDAFARVGVGAKVGGPAAMAPRTSRMVSMGSLDWGTLGERDFTAVRPAPARLVATFPMMPARQPARRRRRLFLPRPTARPWLALSRLRNLHFVTRRNVTKHHHCRGERRARRAGSAAWRRAGLKAPVLVLTAPHAIGDTSLAVDSGADDWLAKPFELDEFLGRLRALTPRA